MHSAANGKSIDPSSRKQRAPQDDNSKEGRDGAPEGAPFQNDLDVFRAFVKAASASLKSTSTTNNSPNTRSPRQRRQAKNSTTASPK
jgi:hypothetical protein